MGKAEKEEAKKLRARVRELELTVTTQKKLIDILRSMPGCQEVRVKDDNLKGRPPGRPKKASGKVVNESPTRSSEGNGEPAGSERTHTSQLEA